MSLLRTTGMFAVFLIVKSKMGMNKYLVITIMLISCSGNLEEERPHFDKTISTNNSLIDTNRPYSADTILYQETNEVNYWDSINYIVNDFVTAINNEGVDISSFNSLEKNTTFKKKIKIYSYNFDSEGTRGIFHWPILQWQTDNVRRAINLSDYIFSDFYEIIELNPINGTYLLLGEERAYTGCIAQIAYVLKISDDKVDLEYPAFAGRPYLWLCNGKFTFDGTTLTYKLNPYDMQENLEESLQDTSIYKQFTTEISAIKIFNELKEDYHNGKSFSLTFDGSYFIKP